MEEQSFPKFISLPKLSSLALGRPATTLTIAKASQNLGATQPGCRVPCVTLGRLVHLTRHCRGGTVAPRPAGLGLL